MAGTSEEWTYFLTRWEEYHEESKLTGTDVVPQLLECCDEDLQNDLTRTARCSLTTKTATEVFSAMRALAVCRENTMVARVALHNMTQDRDETIRAFGAEINGQAGISNHTTKCTAINCRAEVDFTDTILCDVLA